MADYSLLVNKLRQATPSTTDARFADLLGDGLNPNPTGVAPQDPRQLPGPNGGPSQSQLYMQMVQERERLSGVPYGTPASQGGTAQGWQVSSNPTGESERNPGGHTVVARAGDYTGPAVNGKATWQNAGPVRSTAYDANGVPVAPAFQDTLVRGPGGETNLRAPGLPAVIGGPHGTLPGGTLAPVTTGNPAGTPATSTQPATTGANPDAGGAYNYAANGGPGGPASGGAGLPPWLQQAFRDSQGLASIGATRGAGGAAPRVDLANADVKSFLDEERARKGPSEAEALLNKATDRVMAQSLGVAAGSRGTAEDRARATRSALSFNAATGAQASQDVATLRAKEDSERQQRLLSGLSLQGNLAGSADQLGLGYTQAGASLYGTALNGMNSTEDRASREQLAREDQRWREYMFGNLSAADKESYRQAALNRPTFGEQALSTGLSLLPAAKTIKDLVA